MPGARSSLAIASWMLVAACSTGSESAPKVPDFYHPPPPPGQSINSAMCTCRACSKSECCGGAEEPGAGEGKRCDGYDFGAEGCEMSVASCTSRCYEEIWRAQRGETCADRRPSICCEPQASAN
jgi:hypothetical protein